MWNGAVKLTFWQSGQTISEHNFPIPRAIFLTGCLSYSCYLGPGFKALLKRLVIGFGSQVVAVGPEMLAYRTIGT